MSRTPAQGDFEVRESVQGLGNIGDEDKGEGLGRVGGRIGDVLQSSNGVGKDVDFRTRERGGGC